MYNTINLGPAYANRRRPYLNPVRIPNIPPAARRLPPRPREQLMIENTTDEEVRDAITSSSNELVKVCVGQVDNPSYKEYTIHKHVVCKRSRMLYAAFNSTFKEGEEQSINFPEVDPDTFDDWLKHAYCGNAFQIFKGNKNAEKGFETERLDKSDKERIEFIRLVKFSILAEMLIDESGLANATAALSALKQYGIDMMKEGPHPFPFMEATKLIFDGTPDGHKLRNILIDYVFTASETNFDEIWATLVASTELEDIAPDFLKELNVKLLVERGKYKVAMNKECDQRWQQQRSAELKLREEQARVTRRDAAITSLQEELSKLQFDERQLQRKQNEERRLRTQRKLEYDAEIQQLKDRNEEKEAEIQQLKDRHASEARRLNNKNEKDQRTLRRANEREKQRGDKFKEDLEKCRNRAKIAEEKLATERQTVRELRKSVKQFEVKEKGPSVDQLLARIAELEAQVENLENSGHADKEEESETAAETLPTRKRARVPGSPSSEARNKRVKNPGA